MTFVAFEKQPVREPISAQAIRNLVVPAVEEVKAPSTLDDIYVSKKLISKSQNARQRGIEFSMTFAAMRNLLKAKKCFYTGMTLTRSGTEGTPLPTDLTIDRIDSAKGYVKGNVVACCHAFNQLKARLEATNDGSYAMLDMDLRMKGLAKWQSRQPTMKSTGN